MASNQLFLFTGDNRYALEAECRRWEQEFISKHGQDNLLRKAAAKMTLRALLDDVSIAPFLADRRLVIVDGAPKFKKQEVDVLVEQIHPSTILLILDVKSSAKAAMNKEFSAVATVKTFPAMRGAKLQQWVQARVKEEGSTIAPQAAEKLMMLLQADQQFIDSEIRKLAMFKRGETITLQDVDELVTPLEGAIWGVTDALTAGSRQRAVMEAAKLHRAGMEPMGIWNMLITFLRQLVSVSAALEAGDSGPDLAARTGIHPFVLRNLQPYARKVSSKDLRLLVDRAVGIDRDLKTGVLKSTDDAPEELLSALDSVLLRFP